MLELKWFYAMKLTAYFFITSLVCALAILCIAYIIVQGATLSSLFVLGFVALVLLLLGSITFSLFLKSFTKFLKSIDKKIEKEQSQFLQNQKDSAQQALTNHLKLTPVGPNLDKYFKTNEPVDSKLDKYFKTNELVDPNLIEHLKQPDDLEKKQQYHKIYYMLEQLKLLKRLHVLGALDANNLYYKMLIECIDDLIEIYTWACNANSRLLIVKLPDQIAGIGQGEHWSVERMLNYDVGDKILSIQSKFREMPQDKYLELSAELKTLCKALGSIQENFGSELQSLVSHKATMKQILSKLTIARTAADNYSNIDYMLKQLRLLEIASQEITLSSDYKLFVLLIDNLKNIYTWARDVESHQQDISCDMYCKPERTLYELSQYSFDAEIAFMNNKCYSACITMLPEDKEYIIKTYKSLRVALQKIHKDYSSLLSSRMSELTKPLMLKPIDFSAQSELRFDHKYMLKQLELLKSINDRFDLAKCLSKPGHNPNPFYMLLIKVCDKLYNIYHWYGLIKDIEGFAKERPLSACVKRNESCIAKIVEYFSIYAPEDMRLINAACSEMCTNQAEKDYLEQSIVQKEEICLQKSTEQQGKIESEYVILYKALEEVCESAKAALEIFLSYQQKSQNLNIVTDHTNNLKT